MKNMFLRGIIAAPIGLMINVVITIIVSIAMGNGGYYAVTPQLVNDCGSELNAVVVQTVVSLLYGGFFGCASLIWEKDDWSILRQTLTHFIICVAVTFPIAFYMHWLTRNIIGILIYFGIFSFIYFGIWLGLYLKTRNQIMKMNEKINSDKT